jgi:hypothetical protein
MIIRKTKLHFYAPHILRCTVKKAAPEGGAITINDGAPKANSKMAH